MEPESLEFTQNTLPVDDENEDFSFNEFFPKKNNRIESPNLDDKKEQIEKVNNQETNSTSNPSSDGCSEEEDHQIASPFIPTQMIDSQDTFSLHEFPNNNKDSPQYTTPQTQNSTQQTPKTTPQSPKTTPKSDFTPTQILLSPNSPLTGESLQQSITLSPSLFSPPRPVIKKGHRNYSISSLTFLDSKSEIQEKQADKKSDKGNDGILKPFIVPTKNRSNQIYSFSPKSKEHQTQRPQSLFVSPQKSSFQTPHRSRDRFTSPQDISGFRLDSSPQNSHQKVPLLSSRVFLGTTPSQKHSKGFFFFF